MHVGPSLALPSALAAERRRERGRDGERKRERETFFLAVWQAGSVTKDNRKPSW